LRLLAFNTSGPSISAAAAEGEVVRAWRREELARGHAERLLPLLREVIAEAGWSWPELGLLAVAVGPSNFTGLRAGVAVARALGLALGCPALGPGTLEAIAQGAAAQTTGNARPIVAVVDARRDDVYAQRFSSRLDALGPPVLLARDRLLVDIPREPCLLAGDGAAAWARERRGVSGDDLVEADSDARYVAAAARRRLVGGEAPGAGTALRPAYVRPPDARASAGASLVTAFS
jgi:tRNA threonylcarbamoyladenosine biosynthesis protein TsaB